ncbi:hypothetical protein [Chlorogloea sp. CCALA 695]|uniref:hypothetical protein n=1 Tax=Chlorogloea sp. CCALA 695 TaxID=2107693 RepID=UPI000D050982|nr:hypothetical protein [Chlorogloea sp. CCALA 695]PSB34744.1 hypothetical protein C7B70_02575 [Chlorogloea sp. CCALA 695]
MMQSNRLRRLENILDEAVTNGARDQNSARVLLEAMNLDFAPQNIVGFYELLSKAKEDAKSLRNFSRIDRYIKVIEDLNTVFITNHIYGSLWKTFADHIESGNVLNTLDALANYLHSQEPKIFLEQNFLTELRNELEELLNKVLKSDLSKELQKYLSVRIENILKAIRIYNIDGTKGLEDAAKSLLNDLLLTEHKLKDEDKQNPIYTQVKAWGINLTIFLTSMIGVVPDICEFWIPNFQVLAADSEKIAEILSEESDIQEVFKKASDILKQEPNKSISAKEQKALPPSKEDVKNDIEN